MFNLSALSGVNIDQSAFDEWCGYALHALEQKLADGNITDHQIKELENEQWAVDGEGNLKLYISLPDGSQLSQYIDKSKWSYA